MNLWFTDTVPLSEHLSVVILCDAIDDWVASLIADVEVSGLCWVNDRHVLSCGSVGVHAWRLMTFAFMFSLISFVSHQNCTTCTCLAILGYVASLVSANVVGSYTNFNITAVSGGSDSSKSTIRQAIWLQFARVIHKSTQLQSTDVTTVLVVHHRKYFSSFGRVSDSRNSKLHSLWFQNSAGFLCTKFHENATRILWQIILTERQIACWGIFSELMVTITCVSYICRWI